MLRFHPKLLWELDLAYWGHAPSTIRLQHGNHFAAIYGAVELLLKTIQSLASETPKGVPWTTVSVG